MKQSKAKPKLNIFSKVDKIAFSVIGVLALLTVIVWKSVKPGKDKKAESKVSKTEKKKNKDTTSVKSKSTSGSANVTILKKWDMPAELTEISGLSYIDEERFACVQDETGAVFIFNRSSNKIERKVSFAQKGDFEGVAVNGNTVYIVRADGKIFETDLNGNSAPAKQYSTSLTAKHNIEALCFDKENNRLLLANKDEEPKNIGYKGIYTFDLASKTFNKEPVYKIDLNDSIFKTSGKKAVMPSAIAVHPDNGDMYITDGPNARLLILDKDGKVKSLVELGKDFEQPEGISFSGGGDIFISNEGAKGKGNIIMIKINAAG